MPAPKDDFSNSANSNKMVRPALGPKKYDEIADGIPDFVLQISRDLDAMQVPATRARNIFDDEAKVKYLMFLARYGLHMRAAQYAAVDAETVRTHKHEDPPFAEACDHALKIFREGLEQEALSRAMDGWDEPVYQHGRLVGQIHRKSERLLELLLKSNYREKYGDNIQVDQKVTGGVLLVPTALSQQEWLEKYGPPQTQTEPEQLTIEGAVENVSEAENSKKP